ncbi:hypothetical protein TGARI_368420 [Toxoplasma gondii ARI]|uniref:Uncharacterized protein n=1 Tax=Toxoplasma gondii ARI TaxID=1074872 RepID=A0A139Y8R2_TOXGO|nr:hypothetical protein TGARI_368420 [Toxoplasma gondii ARI]
MSRHPYLDVRAYRDTLRLYARRAPPLLAHHPTVASGLRAACREASEESWKILGVPCREDPIPEEPRSSNTWTVPKYARRNENSCASSAEKSHCMHRLVLPSTLDAIVYTSLQPRPPHTHAHAGRCDFCDLRHVQRRVESTFAETALSVT